MDLYIFSRSLSLGLAGFLVKSSYHSHSSEMAGAKALMRHVAMSSDRAFRVGYVLIRRDGQLGD